MGIIKSAIFGSAKLAAQGMKSKKTIADEVNDMYKNHHMISKLQSDEIQNTLKHVVHLAGANNAQLSSQVENLMKANMEMAKVVLDIVKNIHGI